LKKPILIILIISFFLIVLISCATTPIPQYNSAYIPQDFFGLVHAGRSVDDYALLDEMGAIWISETFYWDMIEPQQGVFNFSWYDFFVNTAKENGKKIIAIMAYETPWTGDKRKHISSQNIPHFLNYLDVVVNHFKDRVDVWQIWNEPNFMFWNGSDKEFFELSRLSAQRIRETDPDAFIIGGGLWRTPKGFIKDMYNAGGFENLDAISFHPYAINPKGSMKLHDDFIKMMAELNFTGEVWITEVGYPTGGWYPTTVSMINLPSYVVKTIAGSAARGARTLMWYQFADPYNAGEYPDDGNSEDYFGLTYPDRTKKNGAWAYELCARYLPGSEYIKNLPQRDGVGSNIVSFCFMEGGYGNTLILWNDKSSKQKIKINVGSAFTVHNISTGERTVMPDDTILDISGVPVFITWEGTITPKISRN
jgi:hypothetical protein